MEEKEKIEQIFNQFMQEELGNMIKLSKETRKNLDRISMQIKELKLQYNAILVTLINEKGENGKNYRLSSDFSALIEQDSNVDILQEKKAMEVI